MKDPALVPLLAQLYAMRVKISKLLLFVKWPSPVTNQYYKTNAPPIISRVDVCPRQNLTYFKHYFGLKSPQNLTKSSTLNQHLPSFQYTLLSICGVLQKLQISISTYSSSRTFSCIPCACRSPSSPSPPSPRSSRGPTLKKTQEDDVRLD